MSNLILSSNHIGNKLEGVGGATIYKNTISIVCAPNTKLILIRGVNKVTLLQPREIEQSITGVANLKDVYILENADKKITFKVEDQLTKHETNIYIDDEKIINTTSNKRKATLTLGVIMLALLILSVFFGVRQKASNDFNKASEEKLKKAIEYYELQNRESFILAKEIVDKLKADGYKDSKLDELASKIQESEPEILGEIKVQTKELLDLTLQINGFDGHSLSSSGEIVFVFDKSNKSVLQLDVNGKNAKIKLKGDDLKDVRQIATYQDKLFLDKLENVYELDENSLFYVYAGNVYVLSKSENQIYRYSGNGKTFGEKTEWLAPGIEADFSKFIDITIDGSIWLLSSSGKVTRFTNGNPTSVAMDGIISPLINPTAIYTNEKLKYVYVLEKESGRVVVLEKNGKFKLQYLSEQIKNATDLVVSEEEEKIVLLLGSKLMYFEPKQ